MDGGDLVAQAGGQGLLEFDQGADGGPLDTVDARCGGVQGNGEGDNLLGIEGEGGIRAGGGSVVMPFGLPGFEVIG
ncbi:hypothetical protein ABT168_11800 [Streptomyces sp. NPDC001793]|uniref:hypothetical protein n=1 Tax=Streptomyces sp. NPDC001793 TaxID=3154657 RepID=UPI0033300743